MTPLLSLLRWLLRWPRWLLSAAVFCAVAYLTLAPSSGDFTPPAWLAWPGADKVVHAIMFGTFAAALLIDSLPARSRGLNSPRPVSLAVVTLCIIAATIYGGAVELLQDAIGLGRSGEMADFIADFIGAIVMATATALLLRHNPKRP